MNESEHIAVLIPCHNESATVGKVVDDFRAQLPQATVYVFDNASTDDTASIAAAHGAAVIYEPRLGKGYVVESMFNHADADFYVMVDGDDTYPAEEVHALLAPVQNGRADMVVGSRKAQDGGAFRPFHTAGNNLIRRLVNGIFSTHLTDILSGYRAFNRKVADTLPVVSSGFEVETELTVQMLYHRLTLAETPVSYRSRPPGSESKLRTFRDGARVLWKVFSLLKSFKPLTFFGSVAIVLFVLGTLAGAPAIYDYATQRYVYHVPLAILAVGFMLLSAGSFFMGLLLHAINWRFRELHNVLVRRKN